MGRRELDPRRNNGDAITLGVSLGLLLVAIMLWLAGCVGGGYRERIRVEECQWTVGCVTGKPGLSFACSEPPCRRCSGQVEYRPQIGEDECIIHVCQDMSALAHERGHCRCIHDREDYSEECAERRKSL